jgi:hydrogenase expression/formation protein HypC
MCLAVPGKVVAIFEENGLRMGHIDYAGSVSRACLEYVPEIQVGRYTVVHAGFAIAVLDEEAAQQSFAAWRELTEAVNRAGIDLFGNPLPPEEPES